MQKLRKFLTQSAHQGPLFTEARGSIRESVLSWGERGFEGSPLTTYFGVVLAGRCTVTMLGSRHDLTVGCYFSAVGPFQILGASGLLVEIPDFVGMNTVGGPIESVGRLRYIDGCTDSLLIPPIKRGDPCLNALYFPAGVHQTAHTHPSVRLGLVMSGAGLCHTSVGKTALEPGSAFCIPADVEHSFHTDQAPLTVIAYHPDSDFGPEDTDHPMVNRTIVDGISARLIPHLLTR